LCLQAVRRMEGGSLTEEEVERLGRAFMELDEAIEQIKKEQGISEAVANVREGLDDLVDDALDAILAPVNEVVDRALEDERERRDEPDLSGADAAVGRQADHP
ncbi:MAG: gas vesicle protein K, partial [Candidatus Brocadiae bacterium]|nr:gas vesicle protein K [Candidatus Brocadiia bacterium]